MPLNSKPFIAAVILAITLGVVGSRMEQDRIACAEWHPPLTHPEFCQ